jgi:hypothetical protein
LPEPEYFSTDPQDYIDVLVTRIQEMYEDIANSVNGSFRNEAEMDGTKWIPTLSGSTAGSFTYTQQLGWSFVQGIMVDVWGFVSWSSTTASGTFQVDLPYKVIPNNSLLSFVGTCTPSGITFASGTACNIEAIQSTYYAHIKTYGTSISSAILNVPASGSLTYHLRYIGDSNA